jgi:hypothetical protein
LLGKAKGYATKELPCRQPQRVACADRLQIVLQKSVGFELKAA